MCQEVGYYHLYIIVTNEVGHFSYNNRGYSFGQSSPNAWKPLITPKITHAVLWFEFLLQVALTHTATQYPWLTLSPRKPVKEFLYFLLYSLILCF